MFISNEEKRIINQSIKKTNEALAKALVDITMLTARIKVLEGKKLEEKKAVPAKKPKKKLTAAQRKKQSEYMKAYHLRKRLEKLAQKENANVSS